MEEHSVEVEAKNKFEAGDKFDAESENEENEVEILFESEKESSTTYPLRSRPQYLEKGREKVRALLINKYSQKNGPIVEKHVHNATLRTCKRREITARSTNPELKLIYAEIAYEVLGSPFNAKEAVAVLKADLFGWNAVKFHPYVDARVIEEMDHTKGMQEGISECPGCHLFKTTTWQRQIRSADEGFTNFVICRNKECGRVSRINN